jgi:hypothetical protein
MDEMSLVEQEDAMARNAEGGGAMPLAMQQPNMGNLGQAGSQGVWYKNPTWLALMGVGALATVFVIYAATKKRD